MCRCFVPHLGRYFFPTVPMKQWIFRLFVWIERQLDWLEWRLSLPCRFSYSTPTKGEVLAQYGCAEVHADVIDIQLRDSGYAVHVIREDPEGNCVSDDLLTYRHAIILMEALQEATAFIAERWGPRRLPIVRLWGKRFSTDERLGELRNVDDPNERIELVPVA